MTEEPKKPRLGRVMLDYSYVVDMDNPEMVAEAIVLLLEDLHYAIRHNEIQRWPAVEEDPDAEECDIPSYLANIIS